MEALIRQWTPAGIKAARLVARAFRANAQEAADILDAVPLVLWHLAETGKIAADTRASSVVLYTRRRLVCGWPLWRGIYEWRPGVKHGFKPGGGRAYGRRSRAVALDFDVAAPEPRPEQRPTMTAAECFRMLSRHVRFPGRQAAVLRARLRGESLRSTAARLGLGVRTVAWHMTAVLRKLALYEAEIRDSISRSHSEVNP